MTREEAITKLHWLKAELIKGTDLNEPLDMAIEALQREEAEEKGYCHRIIPKNVEVVVRCKDCRYRKKVGTSYYCELDEFNVQDADFCSWGERKEP